MRENCLVVALTYRDFMRTKPSLPVPLPLRGNQNVTTERSPFPDSVFTDEETGAGEGKHIAQGHGSVTTDCD